MFLSALGLGLGCGTSCGSITTPLLTSFLMSKQSNAKEGIKVTTIFILGKIITYLSLGILSSLVGQVIISEKGSLLGINSTVFFNIFCIIIGIYLGYKGVQGLMFVNKKCSGCSGTCSTTKSKIMNYNKNSTIILFFGGVLYALTPCTPLLIMLGMTANVSIAYALVLMLVFSVANSISPLFVIGGISGYFSNKMWKEIPKFANVISILSGGVFLYIGIEGVWVIL